VAKLVEVVTISDPGLEQAIRDALSKPAGYLTEADMESLTSLDASSRNIANLGGLQICTNLAALDLSDNQISDLQPLVDNAGLSAGDTVDVRDNPLSTESLTVHIPALEARGVTVDYTPSVPVAIPDPNLEQALRDALGKPTGDLTDIDLASLTEFGAGGYNIANTEGLQYCINLTSLNLAYNQISGITPLSALTGVRYLYLNDNRISDITPLSGLTGLSSLYLQDNRVGDIATLSGLTDLRHIDLDRNRITDLQPLVDNAGLDDGEDVRVRGNLLSSDALNVQIPALEARGVTVEHDEASVLDEVEVRRGIESGQAGPRDDAYVYGIDIYGMGLLAAEVTTPWGEYVDTAAMLADWNGQGWGDSSRGALWVDASYNGGEMELEIWWDWLSEDQWATLDTGQTDIMVYGVGGVLWDQAFYVTPALPGETPNMTAPAHRDLLQADGTLTVEWDAWVDPTPSAGTTMIYVAAEEEWMVRHWWTGDEYESEGFLDTSQTQWTFTGVNASAGIYQVRLAFGELYEESLGGVDLTTISFTMSDADVVVGRPEDTIRTGVGAQAGRSYFLTPVGPWEDCQGYAQAFGGNLVTIEDAAQDAWLRSEYGDEVFWIGLNDYDDEGVWEWADGNASAYRNWYGSEPNGGGWENGAVMNYQNNWPHNGGMQWADMNNGEWFRGIAWMPDGAPAPNLADDHVNTPSPSNATPVLVDTPFAGALNYHADIDYFRFTAAAGQAYDILLTAGSPRPGLRDSTMWLYDSDGRTLLTWDDEGGAGSDSRIVWIAPAGGVYYLAVDSYDLEDGLGIYSVEISESDLIAETPDAVFDNPGVWMVAGGTRAVLMSEDFYTGATSGDDESLVIRVLDLTNPLAPTEVGSRYAGWIEDVSFGPHGYLYYTASTDVWPDPSYSELVALDVSGGGDPVEVYRTQLLHQDVDAIAIAGNFAYVGTQGDDERNAYLEVYDLSNPAGATLRGAGLELPGYDGEDAGFDPVRIVVSSQTAYILHEEGPAVSIVDVSDPNAPVLLGQYLPEPPYREGWSLSVADGMAWAGAGSELLGIDVSDPAAPERVTTLALDGKVAQVHVVGTVAYVSLISMGGVVLDIADPLDPQIVETLTMPGATGGATITGGYLYVPTYASETLIFVLDVPGDLNGDGGVDAADIDDLAAAIRDSSPDAKYDLNDDGDLDWEDMDELVHNILETEYGDANLDRRVDSNDYDALLHGFGTAAGWAGGDFDGSGGTDINDFAILRSNRGWTAPPPAPVQAAAPQPSAEPSASTPLIAAVRQSREEIGAYGTSITYAMSAPAIDLPAGSPLPGTCIPGPLLIPADSLATTLHRVATAEYDLRTLGDDLLDGWQLALGNWQWAKADDNGNDNGLTAGNWQLAIGPPLAERNGYDK